LRALRPVRGLAGGWGWGGRARVPGLPLRLPGSGRRTLSGASSALAGRVELPAFRPRAASCRAGHNPPPSPSLPSSCSWA
jgi:hypothetical protein